MKKTRGILSKITLVSMMLLYPNGALASAHASETIIIPKPGNEEPSNGIFTTSSPVVTDQSNMFWSIYGIDEYPDEDIQGSRYGDNSAWTEWDSMKFSWTGYQDLRSHVKQYLDRSIKINGYNQMGEQPNGYIWSWATQERWPDGSFHYDQIPRLINAIYNVYTWTKDDGFLNKVLPKAEFVMDNYLIGHMEGDSGVLTIQDASNDGTTSSQPSNYWDQARYGYQDAWTNAAFYTALNNLAELERAQGNVEKQGTYQALADAFPDQYDSAFWDEEKNRYIGWRDVNGDAHDYGFTYINTEALTRGLGDANKAHQIYDWISAGAAQPTVGGAHVGSTDVYQLIVAPRTNTEDIPDHDNDGWSDPPTGPRPYGEGLPDGGAAMWTSYYDIMARLKYLDADNAFERYDAMLSRVASDSKRLTFNPNQGRFYNDFGESLVEVGTNSPFPESGIAVLAYINGFIGANADIDGLHLSPNLPTALLHAGVKQMNYAGHPITVKVNRGEVVNGNEAHDAAVIVSQNHEASQTFHSSESFDEIGLYLEPYQTEQAEIVIELEKQVQNGWQRVAVENIRDLKRADWVYMTIPKQEQESSYRIRMSSVTGSTAWYFQQSDSTDGLATSNNQSLAGKFVHRVINSEQTTVLQQVNSNKTDKGNNQLGQSFITDVPMSRVGIKVDTPSEGKYAYTVSLYKKENGKWYPKAVKNVRNIPGNQNTNQKIKSEPSEVVLSFSTQQPGEYKVELSNQEGAVGWLRDTQAMGGSGFEALSDDQSVPGQRWYKVYRGQYGIVIPELQVNTSIDAGETYSITDVVPIIEPAPIIRTPEPLSQGSTLGQSFTSESRFNTIILNTPTWTNHDSGYTVTLKNGGPSGDVLYTTEIVNANDGEDTINVGLQEPGIYYVEISNPYKSIGWWTVNDIIAGGNAFMNGFPILDLDREIKVKFIE